MLEQRRRIVIEGTQGFGLSVLHSPYYPFTTSRDTTAASFVSEAGLSPMDVDDIALVIRAFPIRVGGNSGPLPKEVSWDVITKESGSPFSIVEYTSVTHRERRVARFDSEVVKQAIACNHPTQIVLNHVDYIDAQCAATELLSTKALKFVREVERSVDRTMTHIGLGPDIIINHETIETLVGGNDG